MAESSVGSASDYLVVGDPKKSSTWHLRVKRNGKPDHNLMGAAWAALHGGYRGNKYEGPDKSKALAKLVDLYKSEKMQTPSAQMSADGNLLLHMDWKLAGAFPDVPINKDVNVDALKAIDNTPDGDEVFLTLPLMQMGMKAKDGFMYTDQFCKQIMSQMQNQGVSANMGHVAMQDRNSAFPMPKALWVGAMQDANGMVWGKAYMRDPEFKTLIKQMKATNSEMATSIYGTYDPSTMSFKNDGSYEIDPSTFNLESVDFAPPARAALQFKRGAPALTSHMESGENEMTKEELLAQMTVDDVPAEMRDAIIAQFKEGLDTEAVMAQMRDELTSAKAENERLASALAETAKTAVLSQFEIKLTEVVKADTDEGALKEIIRGRVLSHLSSETKPEDIDTLINEAVDAPVYKSLATIVVAQMAGGKIVSQGGDTTAQVKTKGQLAEESLDEIKARVGLKF
jgi:hypothetical protein